jgi:hypothetical protein
LGGCVVLLLEKTRTKVNLITGGSAKRSIVQLFDHCWRHAGA